MSPLSKTSRILSRLEGFTSKAAFKTAVLAVGPSGYDSSIEIAVVYCPKSGNGKTSSVAGLWAIPTVLLYGRPEPGETYGKWVLRVLTKEGLDFSVCGYCPHSSSGNGTCYTWGSVLCKGLVSMLKRFHRMLEAGQNIFVSMQQASRWLRATGLALRNAMYGDQSSFRKLFDLEELEDAASAILGYSHGPEKFTNPGRCMVSADSAAEAIKAYELGLRSFRPIKRPEDKLPFEVLCPSDKVTCAQCKLCDQKKVAKSIAIPFHNFNEAKVRLFMELAVV